MRRRIWERTNGKLYRIIAPSGAKTWTGTEYKRWSAARRTQYGANWKLRYVVRFAVASAPTRPAPTHADYPNATHFSPHFSRNEFRCKDGTPVPKSLEANAVRLANALEELRILVGPIHLLSVYRTPSWNRHVHGARFSQHKNATAADLDINAAQHDHIVKAAKRVAAFHGIGTYSNGGIHVDVRRGPRVYWNDWKRT